MLKLTRWTVAHRRIVILSRLAIEPRPPWTLPVGQLAHRGELLAPRTNSRDALDLLRLITAPPNGMRPS